MLKERDATVAAQTQRKVDEVESTLPKGMVLKNPLPRKPLPGQPPLPPRHQRQRDIVESSLRLLGNARIIRYPSPPPVDTPVSHKSQKKQGRKKKGRFHLPSKPYVNGISSPGNSRTRRKNVETPDDQTNAKELRQLHKNLADVKCQNSPFIPRTFEELKQQEKWVVGEVVKKLERDSLKKLERSSLEMLEEDAKKQKKRCPIIRIPCMGGRELKTAHSTVLSCETMWCQQSNLDKQAPANWPSMTEFRIEGWERVRDKKGYGRFLPVPRNKEFEWRLATPEWDMNPMTRPPVWCGVGPVPIQERQFTRPRGGGVLDGVFGWGRMVDEEFLFDRAEETAREDEAKIIGTELWKSIEAG